MWRQTAGLRKFVRPPLYCFINTFMDFRLAPDDLAASMPLWLPHTCPTVTDAAPVRRGHVRHFRPPTRELPRLLELASPSDSDGSAGLHPSTSHQGQAYVRYFRLPCEGETHAMMVRWAPDVPTPRRWRPSERDLGVIVLISGLIDVARLSDAIEQRLQEPAPAVQ